MSHSIRTHQKSKKGCKNCKLRRVKCDETKPQCAGCTRRGVECHYATNVLAKRQAKSSVHPDPSTPEACNELQPMPFFHHLSEVSHYSSKNLLDLRLMHHYSVFTAQYFARSFPDEVLYGLKVRIPQLALEHDFLMDAVLLVSMIHLGCTNAIALEKLPVYLYRDQALRTLRRAVADVSTQSSGAVRTASVLLATISFATDRITKQPGLWIINWLTLVMGQRNFRTLATSQQHSTLSTAQDHRQFPSIIYGSFADIPAPGVIPIDIHRILSQGDTENDWTPREALHSAAMELGRLIALLEHPCEDIWLETKIKAWAFDIVPFEFFELARQAQPQALVILAYYLTLFKFLPDTWIYQDVAIHDIEHILNTLPLTWEEYISVPKMALQIENRTALAQLLVSCLPGRARGI